MESDPIIRDFLQQNRQTKWTSQNLDCLAFLALKTLGHLEPHQTSTSRFDVTMSITIHNKPHSTHRKGRGAGNSHISYSLDSRKWTGFITNIVKLPQLPLPLLVVKSFIPLLNQDVGKNPYSAMPDLLNASVVYNIHGGHHVIRCDQVIGQLVVVENGAGTFGIRHKTLSIVELTNIVSFEDIQLVSIYSLFSICFRGLCKTTMEMKMLWTCKTCRKSTLKQIGPTSYPPLKKNFST